MGTEDGCELSNLIVKEPDDDPVDFVTEGYLTDFWEARTFEQTVYGNLAFTATFTGEPTSIQTNQLSQITVYSKDGKIIIENAETGSNVSIYDITGSLVSTSVVQKSIETVDIPATPSVYLVRITDGSQSIVKKVMKN